jgi:hypothetical protein
MKIHEAVFDVLISIGDWNIPWEELESIITERCYMAGFPGPVDTEPNVALLAKCKIIGKTAWLELKSTVL